MFSQGDMRMLMAVDLPELRGHKNVVSASTTIYLSKGCDFKLSNSLILDLILSTRRSAPSEFVAKH